MLDVAIGVICHDQQVLLAWRHADRPQGGCWEFPGGKLEADETPAAALKRELEEEIGITAIAFTQWGSFTYSYGLGETARQVRLHIFRVHAFSGEPFGREGQSVEWFDRQALAHIPIPAANLPIVRWLQLPDFYAILPSDWSVNYYAIKSFYLSQLAPGALLYVRLPDAEPDLYWSEVAELSQYQAHFGFKLIGMACHGWQPQEPSFPSPVNPLDGLHLQAADLAQWQDSGWTRPQDDKRLYLGAAHTPADLTLGATLGLDAMTLSPLRATPTHPEQAGLGFEQFRTWLAASPLPVYALGGVKKTDTEMLKAAGAQGIAGIRLWTMD